MTPPSQAGVGHSRLADAFEAGAAAGAMARDASGSLPPAVALVYGTVAYDQGELLRGVRSALPDVPLVGASTQGVSRLGAVEEVDRVVGVALLRSVRFRALTARVAGVSADSEAAGRALADGLRGPGGAGAPDDEPVLVWYDPVSRVNVDALLRGLAAGGFPRVVGGGAGQPFGPAHKTYQYFGGEATSDGAVALRLPGARAVLGLTNGVEPLGYELTVTDASENAIRSIDGQPALDVWFEQLDGGRAHGHDSAAWALGMTLPEGLREAYEGPICRAVFGFDEATRELLLQAPIPTGTRVQLCHRTPRAVFDRGVEMGRRLKARLAGERPVVALSFECAARPAPFLGDARALEEVRQIQAELGPDLPWLGTYAWGEIAPIGARSYFHNYTFPLCVVCDPPDP